MANQGHEMNLTGLLKVSRLSFSEFWAVRDASERAMLSAAFVAAILGLIYALLIDPALTGRKQLNNDLPLLRQQVAQLQALSKEAAALAGKPATTVAAITQRCSLPLSHLPARCPGWTICKKPLCFPWSMPIS
jgi:general secretion pathway protein M